MSWRRRSSDSASSRGTYRGQIWNFVIEILLHGLSAAALLLEHRVRGVQVGSDEAHDEQHHQRHREKHYQAEPPGLVDKLVLDQHPEDDVYGEDEQVAHYLGRTRTTAECI